MRKIRLHGFLACLCLICAGSMRTTGATTPVLLFLSSSDQPDSLGYNIVKALPALVYEEIMEGRIPLWDSPAREIQIKPSTLRRLEESSGTSFGKSQQLFIYELWDLDRKKGALKTLGFYFSNRSLSGSEISYGYVDAEPLEQLFETRTVPTDANGNCEVTFKQVLDNKYYFFNVVQYGTKKVTNLKDAVSLREEAADFVHTRTPLPEVNCKQVLYLIEDSLAANSGEDGSQPEFLKYWSQYLESNREFFYNHGGDRISSFMDNNPLRVTSAEVLETWNNSSKGMTTALESLQLYVNGKPMDSLSADVIEKLDLMIAFTPVKDYLMEKSFFFRITRINTQEIPSWHAAAYLKGLQNWKWNALNDFVKYE